MFGEIGAGGLCGGCRSGNLLDFGIVVGQVNVVRWARKGYLNIPRKTLAPQLGGQSWWQGAGAPLGHGQLSCERFASTLAWAYWPSARNSMKPQSRNDESAAMAPAAFRALIAQVLAAP